MNVNMLKSKSVAPSTFKRNHQANLPSTVNRKATLDIKTTEESVVLNINVSPRDKLERQQKQTRTKIVDTQTTSPNKTGTTTPSVFKEEPYMKKAEMPEVFKVP